MTTAPPGRVASLDLIRGVAVLGILAINIAGFAGPPAAVVTPHLPEPASLADKLAYAAKFLIFEGKMRALFTMLFGASLVLFVERAEAAGRFGDLLQLRRLVWLALFGLLHFYFIWWGDILFLYAACGLVALMMRELPPRTLLLSALAIFTFWHIAGAARDAPGVIAEQRVMAGTASSEEASDYEYYREAVADHSAQHMSVIGQGFAGRARHRLSEETLYPFEGILSSFCETLPLMLIGIVLFRAGFFGGAWPRWQLLALAVLGIAGGLLPTAAILGWAWVHDFPTRAMELAFFYWTAIPHLLMATGYAALLVLAAPTFGTAAIGRRLTAAGRTAFSNYIATSLVMTAIFYGWGLGLAGTVGHAGQWAFVLLGWALMLAWSEPWLRRFRRGPLEWLWRSLTERRMIAFRR